MAVHIWTGETDTDYDTVTNWVGDSKPVNGGSAIIPASATVNIAGFDASAVTLIGFTVEPGCTITIGSKANAVVSPLKITLLNSAAYYNADLGGTGETYLDVADYAKIIVRAAGSAPATGEWGLNLSGTVDGVGAGQIFILASSGAIGIGATLNEDMEVNKVFVSGAPDDVTIGGNVTDNDGSSAVALDIEGGTVVTYCALTTVTKTGGALYHRGSGVVAALSDIAGTIYYQGTGTITNLYISEGGNIDFTTDLQSRTVTNCELGSGGTITDSQKTVTFTNGVDLVRCKLSDVTLDLGKHITLTPSAV